MMGTSALDFALYCSVAIAPHMTCQTARRQNLTTSPWIFDPLPEVMDIHHIHHTEAQGKHGMTAVRRDRSEIAIC